MVRVSKKRLDTAIQKCRYFFTWLSDLNTGYFVVAGANSWLSFYPSYTPSQADVHVFTTLSSAPNASTYPHAARWYTHIKSYAAEHGSLPGSSKAGEAFTDSSSKAPAAAEDEDDDEVDLFGDDEEDDAEAERVKAERVAAYNAKKAGKPKAAAKVRTILFASTHCPFAVYTKFFMLFC
jgi:hypothetical protein